MAYSVYIDSCAWNYLFDNCINLAVELPCKEFTIIQERHVEIEIESMPDVGKDGKDKRPLKNYIRNSIAANRIKTSSTFGFAIHEPDGSLSKIQTYGGFGQGTFQSVKDREWYASDAVKNYFPAGTKIKGSGLGKNQADTAVAARAFDSVLLTDERKTKNGPIRIAAEKGGRVVYLSEDVATSGLSLSDYLRRYLL